MTEKALAKYYEALGQFLQLFAETEALLHNLLMFHAGVDRDVARALFSGVRADAAMSLIDRLSVVRPMPEDRAKDLKNVFDQIRLINAQRNLVIHYGALDIFAPGGPSVASNRRIALDAKRLQEIPISAAILNHMSLDLLKAKQHLAYRHIKPLVTTGQADPEAVKIILDAVAPFLAGAWRYTQPPQAGSGSAGRAARKGRQKSAQHQRRASPA
ncbi:MAG TPA: hypothetical protein VNU97_01970 [Rhizomicrobium sp.]|nr:hypothetical protein [Rhizomicrobium sp.]